MQDICMDNTHNEVIMEKKWFYQLWPIKSGWMKNTKDKWLSITFSGTDAAGIRLLYMNTLQGVRPYYLNYLMWENRSQV